MKISNGEILFRYAKPEAFPDGQMEIPPQVFQDKNLSCDWEKYRKKPEQSFHIAEGRTAIVTINVCDEIRNPTNPKRDGQPVPDWRQDIIHDPLAKEDDQIHGANFSHSLIRGMKKKPVCDAIARNASWGRSKAS